MFGEIKSTGIDPVVPIGGTIRNELEWEATVPSAEGTHTFYLFTVYGNDMDGTLEGFAMLFGNNITITTASVIRLDPIDSVVPDVAEATYDALTLIAESFDGTTISGIYDFKIDKGVLTVELPLGARIVGTSFTAI